MANRILLGNRSSGGYGLYISKPGKDVTSCNVWDLIYDSSKKVAATVHVIAGVTIASGANSGSTTWSAVGYQPMGLVTQTSSATGGNVLGMGHTFTSSFTPPSSFNYVVGNVFVCLGPTSTGCTILKSDGTNVSSDTFFRIVVFRYPLPS
jgi:hypothetical protein